MSVKAKVEAIIYAAEEPVTLNQLASLLRDAALSEISAEEQSRSAATSLAEGDAAPGDPESRSAPATPESQPLSSEEATSVQADEREKADTKKVKVYLAGILEELTRDYSGTDHGVEVRQIAGGYRMGTKPEHHDVVVGFAKSLKPPVRLSLQALETLAVIAYKQPVTVPEISEIRGVDSSGVIATLLDRKLVTTAGRKQVIGRPILYKTTKEFLLRFGLNNVSELPSMEEFEKLGDPQAELFAAGSEGTVGDPDPGADVAHQPATTTLSGGSDVQEATESTQEDPAVAPTPDGQV